MWYQEILQLGHLREKTSNVQLYKQVLEVLVQDMGNLDSIFQLPSVDLI